MAPEEEEAHPRQRRRQAKQEPEEPTYEIGDGSLWKKSSGGSERLCKVIALRAVFVDSDTGAVSLEVEFEYGGRTVVHNLERRLLYNGGMNELLSKGSDVTPAVWLDVVDHLKQQEEVVPSTVQYRRLGWGSDQGHAVFWHHRAIGHPTRQTQYSGELDLAPKGTLKEWRRLVLTEVKGRPLLELILVIGLSSALLGPLADVGEIGSLFIHIQGDSTTGKTTAVQVAVSVWGLPELKQGGLLKSWLSTDNALVLPLRNNFGVAICFDEASLGSGEFTKQIYSLAQGIEKARMTDKSRAQESFTWRTTVLSTGEESLLGSSKPNTGLAVRLLEIRNRTWTDDGDHSARLKEGLRTNYGTAGPRFVRHLMEVGRDEIVRRWREWHRRVIETTVLSKNYARRVGEKLAVLLLTAELANEALKLSLDVDRLRETLLEIERSTDSLRSVDERALDYLADMINLHPTRFQPGIGSINWGRVIVQSDATQWVEIFPTAFKDVMRSGGFSASTVLKGLEKKGLLDCEPGKLTKKVTLGNQRPRVHRIRLDSEEPQDQQDAR